MIVAPFTYTSSQTQKGIQVHRINLLCQGGKQPWVEENQPIEDILEPNGIFTKQTTVIVLSGGEKCVLALVDTKKTDMTSMYSWHEIDIKDEENLCWRTFTFGTSGSTMWLPYPKDNCSLVIEAIYKNKSAYLKA
jgi:hypothetical protein